jgi:hypothetical protein
MMAVMISDQGSVASDQERDGADGWELIPDN